MITEPKLVQQGDNNMLIRQPIENHLLVIPNSVQSNDILVNLITSVSFLGIICPKSCVVFQVLSLSIFQLWYKELTCPLEYMSFHFFSFWISLFFCGIKMRQ
jgi:hypothetical protein